MTYAVGDRVRVRADAPLHPTVAGCLANMARAHRRGQVGDVVMVRPDELYGPYNVRFSEGHAWFPADYLEPAGNDYYAAPVQWTWTYDGGTTIQPPTPVAEAPGSVAPPESLPGSLDAGSMCPTCMLPASRPSPIARRVERVVTDPIGAALIAWLAAVGGALWLFK